MQDNRLNVQLKIPLYPSGFAGEKIARAEIYTGEKLLWQGYSGQIASFSIEIPLPVFVRIINARTGASFPFFKTFDIHGTLGRSGLYQVAPSRNAPSGYFIKE